ncbi:MAG TPA: crossover junction endodeoxyribonuclease RuvC [Kofleriaceae bacterium]|nr:crossover junction endodeoxyribonuclease RuvC [Kofleriaceae bacterium]
MRILGIDPGSRVCGYGMVVGVEGGGAVTYVECGVVTAPEERSAEERLGEIACGLGEVIDELRPTVIALEDVFTRINPRSALALAQARGMVLAVAGLRRLAVASYTAPLVKKQITGRGRADKEQVARMVAALAGLRTPPRADAADALALAITHARMSAGAELARQRTRPAVIAPAAPAAPAGVR